MTHTAVRQANVTDLDMLTPLFNGYRQFYGRATDLDAARQFLLDRINHGESVIFMALREGVPVGFTQLYPSFSSVSMARTFLLNDLFVTEEGRRNGVASALMSAAVAFAKTVGAIRLSLSTAVTNSPAQSLYSAMGWAQDEQFFVYHLSTGA
jgi:GNAT superfamily N-acetyltransferase